MRDKRFRIGTTYISITSPENAKERITQAVNGGENAYICVSNPRTVVHATRHKDYREVMEQSMMNLPDAEPMIWAAKLWGLKEVKRTMGPLLFQAMIIEPSSGIRHFLLGDTEETLNRIVAKASKSGALIAGIYSPPFCKLEEYDYEDIAKRINDSGADVVWTAMRAPKQDFFDRKLLSYLDNKVCVGVGAAFRFYLGEYKMAPPFIKKLGLMGLYWGKKNQTWIAFIWTYLVDNAIPYFWYLFKILIRRLTGKKYFE